MKPTEAAALLAIAAAYDNRRPDADQAKAWAMALEGHDFADCRTAIVEHYRKSRDWLMPADVIAGVERIRTERRRAYGPIPPPEHLDPHADDFDAQYARYFAETSRAICAGTLLPGQLPVGVEPEALKPRDVIGELGHIGQDVPDA